MHCTRKTFLSYDNEWTCVACGKNGIKRKIELDKISRKKDNFYQSINRQFFIELNIDGIDFTNGFKWWCS